MFVPSSGFGDDVQPSQVFRKLMGLNKKLCSTDLQIVLRTAYEETYGIVHHSVLEGMPAEEAFALVTLNDNENVYLNDPVRARAKRFAINRMANQFGMSYKEFIELPHSTCDMLFEISEELINAERPIINSLNEEISKL